MRKIEISPRTILIIYLIPIGLFLAWSLRGIIIALLISLILMSGFAPLVDWFQGKLKFPKILAVIATYLLAIIFLVLLLFVIIPPLFSQTKEFFSNFPFYVGQFITIFGKGDAATAYTDNLLTLGANQINTLLNNIVILSFGVFSGIFAFLSILLITFYLLLERDKIKENIFIFFPHLPKERVKTIAHRIEEKLGAWVRGQLILSFLIGLTTYIGLFVLGVDFALPLAVIAAVLELIPIIGPILSAIPAIIVALVQSSILGIGVAALYLLIQQLENTVIVPKVMEKAVGLSPLVIILALMIGGTTFGVLGALVSVPVAAVISVIFEDFKGHRQS